MVHALVSALLSVALMLSAAPAHAGSRWKVATVRSSQPGCGLAATVTYRTDARRVVIVDRVLATGLRGAPVSLSIATGGPRWSSLLYTGPNGRSTVGDGVDYEWTRGWELNGSGERVRIGASGLNPTGWPKHGVRGSTLLVQVPAETPERQCRVELVLP